MGKGTPFGEESSSAALHILYTTDSTALRPISCRLRNAWLVAALITFCRPRDSSLQPALAILGIVSIDLECLTLLWSYLVNGLVN